LAIASLLAMQMISRLQDELDIEVQFSDLLEKKTIGDLDAFIHTQLSNPGM
jgi:acyl carrier protein